MNVLEKIKKLQKERGWTTYKLAYEACLTQSTLSNMFARGTCPTVDTLEKICDAFGITLSKFFENDESKIYVSKEETLILADQIEFKEDIDIDRARESEKRAKKRLEERRSETDIARAELALKKAINRIKIASK